MLPSVTPRRLTPSDRNEIEAFLEQERRRSGRQMINDHLIAALHDHDDTTQMIGVRTAEGTTHDDGELIAYGQASKVGGSWVLGLVHGQRVANPSDPEVIDETAIAVISLLIEHIRSMGGGRMNWWVPGGGETAAVEESAARVAATLGLETGRILVQMRRPLPLTAPTDLVCRSFVVGQDEDEWLRVNNRAFAGHHEQGHWDLATLRTRENEPWFDPAGFLLHERDGRLAGFCWTKIHRADARNPGADAAATEEVGEIYVIAVDPDFHGLGLGRELTRAGLDSIAARGVRHGMLYVDGDNAPARMLYESLGFEVHRLDRAYTCVVDPAPPTQVHTARDAGDQQQ